jgi:hypothetical protein
LFFFYFYWQRKYGSTEMTCVCFYLSRVPDIVHTIFLSGAQDIVTSAHDTVSHAHNLVTRAYDLFVSSSWQSNSSRAHDVVANSHTIYLPRAHDLVSRSHATVYCAQDIISRTHEINRNMHMSHQCHRSVRLLKSYNNWSLNDVCYNS